MREIVTGSGSLLVKSSTALVAWPLMSFTPKTSELGKEAETERARLGVEEGFSASSSTCREILVRMRSFRRISKLLAQLGRELAIDLQHRQQRR